MKHIRYSLQLIALSVFLTTSAFAKDASPTAYREEISTPHWQWVDQHAGGTLKALFITSFLGAREPEELAQRFDMTTDVVPVSANPSAIPSGYDEAYLIQALATRPDVIVVSYRGAWSKLSEDARLALVQAVKSGIPLISLSAGNAPNALQEEAMPELDKEAEALVERNLAVERLHFPWGREGGRIGLKISRSGKGYFINVGMGHGAGGGFNSFIPSAPDASPSSSPSDYEIAYAVFGRLIRWAAGKAEGAMGAMQWKATPTLGAPLVATAELTETAVEDVSVEWEVRSPFGDLLAQSAATIPAGSSTVQVDLPLSQAGELTLLYRLRSHGKVTDVGALAVPVKTPITRLAIRVPTVVAPGEPVPVSWSLEGDSERVGGFLLQVYDTRRRLVAWARCAPDARECRLEGWRPQDIRHHLRLLVLDKGEAILFEQRTPLNVQVERSNDLSQFHVMAWATEKGEPQEQWRYDRLRQLGINAFSSIGKGMAVPEMAADAGLRLAPVNICVPPGRFKKVFNPAEERDELATYIQAIAPLSPIGYSLADEPGGVDLIGFRNWAAGIIQQQDPGARVGYCGTHMKVGLDVPGILANCDFMIHYTPHYLYTSDLWRGIERDLHRAFTPAGALNTAYTHYVPWADHEPYSRVTPWLLLFEEANGISYFASAGGNFSILDSDLRTTHETRWWSEEILELQQGISTQLIAMERDNGGIALLFPTHLPEVLTGPASSATTTWAKAMRALNLPFTFVASDDLSKLDPATTPLLICPPTPALAHGALNAVQQYVEQGGALIAMAPFALVEPETIQATEPPFWERQPKPPAKVKPPVPTIDGKKKKKVDDDAILELLEEEPAKQEAPPPPPPPAAELLDIEPLFGIRRPAAEKQTREELFAAFAQRSRIPTEFTWTGESLALEGSTAGEAGLIAADAASLATFPEIAADAPAFAREALSSPAVFRVRRGKGSAIYFNVVPTAEAAQVLLKRFQAETGAAPAPAQVTVDNEPAPAVYLYPMQGGGVRTLGIIQDHERVKPAFENKDKQTAIYFHHGPQLWADKTATLQLDKPVHLYDTRRKLYFGETATADFLLRPGRAELFALLPYKVTAIELATAHSVRAGAALKMDLRLVTSSGKAGDHTVHVRLAPKNGSSEPTFAGDVMLASGRGTLIVPTTFSDPPGQWLLQATDVLSGVRAETEVRIEAVEAPGPLLPRRDVEATKVALNWPQGEWQPYQDADAKLRDAVNVHVGGIQRRVLNFGAFDGMWCLHAKTLVGLTNSKTSFGFTYLVCNDWEKKGWKDQRRAQGASLSGLGMNRPAGHLWNYNGYIDISFDDVRVTGFRIADAEKVEVGNDGRVDLTWESPSGDAILSFGLTLDGEALLQQLEVRPSVAVENVKVEFRSYIGDFGQSNTRYVLTSAGKNARVTNPAEAPWAFYADDVNDQAYGKGKGAGGILIIPEQWDRVKYGMQGELVKKVDLQPGETASFQWALWLYPNLTNEEALDAFKQSHGSVLADLRKLFPETP